MSKGSDIFRSVLRDARKQLLLDYETSSGFGHSGIKGDERAEEPGDTCFSTSAPKRAITVATQVRASNSFLAQVYSALVVAVFRRFQCPCPVVTGH